MAPTRTTRPAPARRPLARRRYTMMELVWAMIVLGVVLTGFFGYVRMMQTMDARLRQQQRGIVVLDNTLERLAAAPQRDEATARTLLAAEFAAMAMPGKEKLQPVCQWHGARLELRINRANGTAVASVELGP